MNDTGCAHSSDPSAASRALSGNTLSASVGDDSASLVGKALSASASLRTRRARNDRQSSLADRGVGGSVGGCEHCGVRRVAAGHVARLDRGDSHSCLPERLQGIWVGFCTNVSNNAIVNDRREELCNGMLRNCERD